MPQPCIRRRPQPLRLADSFVWVRRLAVFLAIFLLSDAVSYAQPVRAGAAKRKVTPPAWAAYLTSSGNGTNAPFAAVHDDLFARAVVFDDGREAIAVLAVDSLGYDNAILGPGRNFTGELRERIASQTGLQPSAIMLAASHTHSAPETIGLTPFRELPRVADWLERHLDDLAATVVDAWADLQPVQLRFGKKRIQNFGRYRRILLRNGELNRHGPLPAEAEVTTPWKVDEELSVLYSETPEGRTHSVLLNFTAHPVIAMLLPEVSADYPGASTARIEESFSGAVCLFTQGAAGNINSPQVSGTFADVEAAGKRLAAAAMDEIQSLKKQPPLAAAAVSHRSRICRLEARPCPTVEEALAQFEKDRTPRNERLLRLARKLADNPLEAEVQEMQVGPIAWVSLPGEPFVETGFGLKAAGASFVVGYANGYLGYFPIRRAYDEGGYEADPGPWSRVAPGSAERLEEAGRQLLDELRPRKDRLPNR